LAPRLLAFFGTDRSRYAAAFNVQSFTGIAPVTNTTASFATCARLEGELVCPA